MSRVFWSFNLCFQNLHIYNYDSLYLHVCIFKLTDTPTHCGTFLDCCGQLGERKFPRSHCVSPRNITDAALFAHTVCDAYVWTDGVVYMKKYGWRNKWGTLRECRKTFSSHGFTKRLVTELPSSLGRLRCCLASFVHSLSLALESQADASGDSQPPESLHTSLWSQGKVHQPTDSRLLGGQSRVSAPTAQPCRLRLPLETLCPRPSVQVIWSRSCRSSEPFLRLCLSVGHEWPLACAWATRVTRLASARTLDSCRTGRVWKTFLPTDSNSGAVKTLNNENLPLISDSVSPFSNAMLKTAFITFHFLLIITFLLLQICIKYCKMKSSDFSPEGKKLKTQSNITTRLMFLHFDNPIYRAS